MSSWTDGYVTDLGYTHGFYRELTPALLAFAALVAGKRPPNLDGPLNYCELGSGQGFSANLIAATNPNIEVYANDFNPAQTVGAQRLAEEAGTPNVHFSEQSFKERLDDASLPEFDIIALHGIYSWISPENRDNIVEFIRRKLKPGGLVYLSYNCLPGWAAAAPLRHLLYLHGKAEGGPTISRLDPALAFVDQLIEAKAGYFQVNPALKERVTQVRGQNRNYLAHEYMNDAWNLLYFSDVATELEAAKLTFVASANLLDHLDAINLTPEQQHVMLGVADPTLRQTVRDFMVNQQFRRDVFLKGPLELLPAEVEALWMELRFALSAVRADIPLKVKGMLGDATLQDEVYTPVLDAMAKGPRTVSQLVAEPAIAALGWARLVQALAVLVGAGHLQPCLDAEGDAKRATRTRAFNNAVMARSRHLTEFGTLASPVTGGGIGVDRITQLLLLAHQQEHANPAQFVWDIMKLQGHRLLNEGRAVESDEENLTLLGARFEEFTSKHLPLLQQLGIA